MSVYIKQTIAKINLSLLIRIFSRKPKLFIRNSAPKINKMELKKKVGLFWSSSMLFFFLLPKKSRERTAAAVCCTEREVGYLSSLPGHAYKPFNIIDGKHLRLRISISKMKRKEYFLGPNTHRLAKDENEHRLL